jgi:two-component SAPR family response regulator
LRNIFKDIQGITLHCQDINWYFSFDSAFYCDYIEYRKKIHELDKKYADEDNNLSELYYILKRGPLFSYVQENWIDIHKQKHDDKIQKILWNYMYKLNEANDYAKLIKYSDLCFIIDPLDEKVFKLCMHALQKTGKKQQFILLYDKFVSDYKELLGEEPDLSFMNL